MRNKAETIVGLDIGTNAIRVAVAEIRPEGKLDVVGIGTAPSRGLRKGVVINIESTVEAIGKAISQAETMAGTQISAVYAAISGNHIRGFNSHGIVAVKNREVAYSDVEKVIEAAKAVAIPMDREVLHVLPQEFIIDEQDGIKEPVGISGVRLEARVHIVTGAVASAQNIVKCANRCGLTVKDIVLSSLSSARAVLSAEEQELGVCLIDIGGGTTDIILFHNGAVKFTGVIPIGGGHITNDIAAGLRTPLSAAEEIKCVHGTALSSSVRKDQTIEVPSTGGRQSRVVSKQILAEIIEPRVQEIFQLAQREIHRAGESQRGGLEQLMTSGVVLTGGTANLGNIAQVAEQIFSVPVRVGLPTGVGGLVDLVKGPEFSTVVGMLHHGATIPTSSKFFAGASNNILGRYMKRVSGWFAEHF